MRRMRRPSGSSPAKCSDANRSLMTAPSAPGQAILAAKRTAAGPSGRFKVSKYRSPIATICTPRLSAAESSRSSTSRRVADRQTAAARQGRGCLMAETASRRSCSARIEREDLLGRGELRRRQRQLPPSEDAVCREPSPHPKAPDRCGRATLRRPATSGSSASSPTSRPPAHRRVRTPPGAAAAAFLQDAVRVRFRQLPRRRESERQRRAEAQERQIREHPHVEVEVNPIWQVQIHRLRPEQPQSPPAESRRPTAPARPPASRFPRATGGRSAVADAPSAARRPISRARWTARATSRLAAFAHAMSRTNAPAAIRITGGPSVARPTIAR